MVCLFICLPHIHAQKSNEQKEGVQLITGSLRLHSVFLEYSASLMFGSDSVHCRFAVQIATYYHSKLIHSQISSQQCPQIEEKAECDLRELQREDQKWKW